MALVYTVVGAVAVACVARHGHAVVALVEEQDVDGLLRPPRVELRVHLDATQAVAPDARARLANGVQKNLRRICLSLPD